MNCIPSAQFLQGANSIRTKLQPGTDFLPFSCSFEQKCFTGCHRNGSSESRNATTGDDDFSPVHEASLPCSPGNITGWIVACFVGP